MAEHQDRPYLEPTPEDHEYWETVAALREAFEDLEREDTLPIEDAFASSARKLAD